MTDRDFDTSTCAETVCSEVPTTRPTAPRVQIQPRDIDLIVNLYSFGCMLRSQLQACYFGSTQRTNARLLRLARSRYIAKATFPLPSCMGSANSLQAAYMLGPAGIPLVCSRFGLDPSEVRRQLRHGTPAYISHTVEVAHFWLSLKRAVEETTNVTLTGFFPERLCRHEYQYREHAAGQPTDGVWRQEIYKPDAVFVLTCHDWLAGFAVEIDLGHTSSAALLNTLHIHTRYTGAGLYHKRYGAPKHRTLVVTTTTTRLDNLKQILVKAGSNLFWFTTFRAVADFGAFGRIWHAPNLPGLQCLVPRDHPPLVAETENDN